MLSKNEIIKGLKSTEIFIKNGIYEYICNLHLYDDDEINEAFIEFLKENYKVISYTGLIQSKLNPKIIECLIQIYINGEVFWRRNQIEDILIEHYNIIKNLNYNFEEIFEDERNLLLYKKIKHFSKKEPRDLNQMYFNQMSEYYSIDVDEDEDNKLYTLEVLIEAMGIALIQSEEGFNELLRQSIEFYEDMDEDDTDFLYENMYWFLNPLCKSLRPEAFDLIFKLYTNEIDDIDDMDCKHKCDYFFSTISNEHFVKYYINFLRQGKSEDIEPYFYDIAQYINSKELDDFLMELLNQKLKRGIRENIIRVLACKLEERVIPYATEYVKHGHFENERSLKVALTPILMITENKDTTAKEVIEFSNKVFSDIDLLKDKIIRNLMPELIPELQKVMYENNENIKEYKKYRKIYEDIVQEMMEYFDSGNFRWTIDNEQKEYDKSNAKEMLTSFDRRTNEGSQAMANILIFKNSFNMNCITEEFLEKRIYNEEEKIEMLQSMLKSEAGLFEITNTDLLEGKVDLKNVFNRNEYTVTDIALSTNINYDDIYIYTRIIKYNELSFCSGLIIPFFKNDVFIKRWIDEKKYSKKEEQEITKFLELYNEHKKNDHGIRGTNREVFD